jgi:large subunit ribosomal protein L17
VIEKLFGELAERYASRPGGYSRIIHKGKRHGDNADLSIIELVDRAVAAAGKGEGEEAKGAKAPKAAPAEKKSDKKAKKAKGE